MELTSQFFAVVLTTAILVAIAFAIYKMFKGKDPVKDADHMGRVMVESAVIGFDKMAKGIHGGRLARFNPFFMTIMLIIGVGSLVSLLGWESPLTTVWFTLGLASITFVGIYVIGITSRGLWGFSKDKYSNPLELFGQFGPVLSMTIRLFGGAFAFSVLGNLMVIILGEGFGAYKIAAFWPLINSLYGWVLKAVDTGLAFIQAYVFIVLTMMYWDLSKGNLEEKTYMFGKEKRQVKDKLKHDKLQQIEIEAQTFNNRYTELWNTQARGIPLGKG